MRAPAAYEMVLAHRLPVLILLGVVVATATLGLLGLRVDMSFRSLFAQSSAAARATEDFESVFGQPSGASIIAVLEHEGTLSPEFLRAIATASEEVSRIKHVAQVRSPTHFLWPVWSSDRIELKPALEPEVFARPEELIQRVQTFAREPALSGALVAPDFTKALIIARLDLPLADLENRRPVIEAFRSTVQRHAPENTQVHFVGVSVVESAYADLVLKNLLIGTFATFAGLCVLLRLLLGRISRVLIVISGVTIATPLTLSIMNLLGLKITILSSTVPIMILIIGIADSIHMLHAFSAHRRLGLSSERAVRAMCNELWAPCLLTSLTTAAGFLALQTAEVRAIRELGLAVSIGVPMVYLLNQILVPLLLQAFAGPNEPTPGVTARLVDRWVAASGRSILRRPWVPVIGSGALIVICIAQLPDLRIDQRFNEEVAPEHPVRVSQALIEDQFGGLLGPELSIRRRDGGELLDDTWLRRLRTFSDMVRAHAEVRSVRSVADFIPSETPLKSSADILRLRRETGAPLELREVINTQGTWASVIVRTTDMGTQRAQTFHRWLTEAADTHFGPDYELQIVGQWWLAQEGMIRILEDMLVSFLLAAALVLPVLAITLRRARLLLVSIVPNLLPMLVALGFMAIVGIEIRIGTAVILAIALGITVDDTIHTMTKLKREQDLPPESAITRTLNNTGRAVVSTTLALCVGFAGLAANDLLAIRDMGIVAAVTVASGLIADVYLAPALFLLSAPGRNLNRAPMGTSAGRLETRKNEACLQVSDSPAAVSVIAPQTASNGKSVAKEFVR